MMTTKNRRQAMVWLVIAILGCDDNDTPALQAKLKILLDKREHLRRILESPNLTPEERKRVLDDLGGTMQDIYSVQSELSRLQN